MKAHSILTLIFFLVTTHTQCAEITQQTYTQEDLVFKMSKYAGKISDLYTIKIVAEASRGALGSIDYKIFYAKKSGKKSAEIINLLIESPYRRQNLGSVLMLSAFKHMRMKEVAHVIWISQREAIPFYKRFGSREYEDHMEFDFDLDGDPEENLKKNYLAKAPIKKQNSHTKNTCVIS